MDRRPLLALLGVAVIAGAVAETEQISQPEHRPDRVIVTYWEKWSDFEADAMRKVVNEFNRRQDKIFVNFLSTSGIENKTIMATAGGIPPDIAGLFGANLPLYAYYEAIMPLDEVCAKAGVKKDDYIPVFWDICTYKGKLYALPTTPATTALHYNRKILRDVGWDPDRPPATIEELDELDKRAMILDKQGHVVRAGFMPTEPGWWPWSWPYFFGGTLMDDKGKVTTDLPDNVRAYTWMASFAKRYGASQLQSFKQGFANAFNSPQNAFLDKKVATVLQGVWMANFIQKYTPDLDWAASPFPTPADRPELKGRVIADLDIVVIPRGAKHPQEAFEFLKFLQSQEGMELLCMGQKKYTPLMKVSPSFYANHPNPFIKLFRDQSLSPNVFYTPRTPIWNRYQQELQVVIDKMNLLDKRSVKDLLGDVKARVQPMQDEVDKIERLREEQKKR
ncbi:MAG: ABC transporter substrate-binding protein [Fimbriimonadaceae bacterium]|nr:ABC transporter substrate-binding protein [Fimbriimonadaceae bacterium]